MKERIVRAVFAGEKSLLASPSALLLVGESLQVEGRWKAAKSDVIFTLALSENGEHAAVGMSSSDVIVWSTKSPTSRVVFTETMKPEEKLMAGLLGETLTPPAARLAISNDGEMVAILRELNRDLTTLTLVGRHEVTREVARVEPWTRMSMEDDHVVLGRHHYALSDLACAQTDTEEVFARSDTATLLRSDEGAILLREGETLSALGEWDDAAFAGNEVVLVRLHAAERLPRSLEVSIHNEMRVLPWDLPDESDPYGELPAVADCANLRGVIFEDGGNVWVDLRSGARLSAVESLHIE